MPDTNLTTFDLPNYVGQLFQKGSRENALLQLIGGINGARIDYASTEFPVGQQYEVPAHASDRSRVEGAAAPDHAGVTRSQVTNVTQIVQEKVIVSYTKEATAQQLAGLNIGGATNPVVSELDFQTGVKMELIQRNLNWAFINNTYNKPVNNNTARRTRGLLEAITTNVLDSSGDRDISLDLFDEAMGMMLESGGIADGDSVIALAGPAQLRNLNALFRQHKIEVDADRFVGGTRVRTVYTTFGVLNFALELDMPDDTIVLANIGVMGVRGTPIPGKGVLFQEPLAKTGASEAYQIYGELGFDHGPEWMHAKITDLNKVLTPGA